MERGVLKALLQREVKPVRVGWWGQLAPLVGVAEQGVYLC